MKRIFLSALLALSLGTVLADNVQTLTIDGTASEKKATACAFSGDNVILTLSDNSTETYDMSLVVITFNEDTAIRELEKDGDANAPVLYFDMSGKQLQGAPAQGTYIMKKGKKIVKLIKN